MGFVYHGHYLVYFEQGRTEFMRSLGATYRQVEESGTLLVVVETGLKFHEPARYDDELLIHTNLAQHRGVRMRFEYEIRRNEALLVTGFTVLASCDLTGRPRRMPAALASLVRPANEARGAKPESGRKVPPSPDVQGTPSCS